MRICLLTDETIEEFNPSQHLTDYEWDLATVQRPIFEFMSELSSRKQYDVYLNMFDGDDDDNAGFQMVCALEKLKLAFTGADSKCYDPSREEMQAVAEANQLNFARGFHAKSDLDLAQADALNFPLIVKHPNSFASIGLTRSSRVETKEQLKEQFQITAAEFGSARVEEFIEGREVSCLVVDNPDDLSAPYAYLPAEVIFPSGETFLHEEVKWYNWDTYVVRLEDKNICERVQNASTKMFSAIGGTGYARVDLRIRPNGELVILEINPNCGILFYGPDDRSHADLPITWDKDGHKGFLERIFQSAILRRDIRKINS
ncbi:MAG: hypothetical protein H7Y59_13545 [Anaerolineales bacterium]|nr:hypothetical protein [Anaerolineales bacterium]